MLNYYSTIFRDAALLRQSSTLKVELESQLLALKETHSQDLLNQRKELEDKAADSIEIERTRATAEL